MLLPPMVSPIVRPCLLTVVLAALGIVLWLWLGFLYASAAVT